jgi:FKBP-type peptidyl-prolyl cis-trans isomerase SlyD
MQISQHKVVTIDYTLTDNDGTIIDSSEADEPLAFIQGIGNIVPGLEAALEGRNPGDAFKVSIAPAAAYGERDEALMQVIDSEIFSNLEDLQVGVQFEARSGETQRRYTVMAIEGDRVTVDGNHPLAGVTLNFEVLIKEVREATAEELSHGHAHSGAQGH